MIRDNLKGGWSYVLMILVFLFVVTIGLDTARRGVNAMLGPAMPASEDAAVRTARQTTLYEQSQGKCSPGATVAGGQQKPKILGMVGQGGSHVDRGSMDTEANRTHVLTWSDDLNLGAERGGSQMAKYMEAAGFDLGQWFRIQTENVLSRLLNGLLPFPAPQARGSSQG